MKELKTCDELVAMMVEAAHKTGKCATLAKTSIFVHRSSEPHTNWDYGTNTKIAEDCRRELNKILGELRLKYDCLGSSMRRSLSLISCSGSTSSKTGSLEPMSS